MTVGEGGTILTSSDETLTTYLTTYESTQLALHNLDDDFPTDVTVSVSSSDTGEATVTPATLTFTEDNWETPQTVTVPGVNDNNSDGHQDYDINLSELVVPSKALDFDGVNDYVATASNISALDITADITIESWVNISSMPNDYARIIGKGRADTIRTYGLWVDSSGKLLFQMGDAATNGLVNLFSNTALSTGAWHHIIATRSGNTVTIYVNGVADGTITYSGTPYSTSEPLTFGYGNNHAHFPGKLDEVAVWDKGLSAAEITTLYNSGGGSVSYTHLRAHET